MSYLSLSRALRPVIESLEPRQLFHGGAFDLHVNFQPAGAVVPSGYLVDAGKTYADRGNGFTYGWNADNTIATRERNTNADQRLDTFIHTQAYGTRTWEVAVPNGLYVVHIVAGDPGYNDSVYKINAEGVLTVNGTPTAGNRFVEGTQTVNVTDGKLTISSATGAVNNKIAYLEIDSADDAQATVNVTATDPTASESGDTGLFTFTRTNVGITEALDISFSIAGSATNGADYSQLLNTVTIPAGQTSVTAKVTPIDDTIAEPTENVVVTILADDAYEIGAANSAAVTIADNDTTTGTSGSFSAHINFQPASAPTFSGYAIDSGQTFADRGNGLSYGWSGDNTTQSRDRNAAASPDQRYDTLVQFNNKKWEMAVPNGTYSVHVVAGDPSYTDSVYKIDAEGTRVVDGAPSSSTHWIDGTVVVTVTDGKLTISIGAGASNDKINYIDVAAAGAQTPILNVSAPATNASENGPTARSFTVTRTGDLSKPLTVYYVIGGSATNGVDYNALASPVTIPAGSASIDITVNPIDDPNVEGVETVTLTLAAQAEYAIGAQSNATIRINDNDSPTGNTITWTTKASNPVIRAEALRAVVEGKLYVFGGFDGDLGPITRSDVFDPVANTWTQLPDVPTRLSHAGVAVDGHDIYVCGGYVGIGATGYNQQFGTTQTWKYNVDTKQWTAFVALPKAIAGGGLVLLGRELHWVGGNNNQRQDIGDHYYINLDNLTAGWKTATSLPHGRSHLGLVTLNGKIYAVGGQFGNDEGLTTQSYVDVWDPAAPDHWTSLANLPTPISHIASATFVLGNRIITAGGETAHNVPTDLVYAYDIDTGIWTALTKLPAKRFSGVGAAIGNDIYFTTGSSQTTTWKGVIS